MFYLLLLWRLWAAVAREVPTAVPVREQAAVPCSLRDRNLPMYRKQLMRRQQDWSRLMSCLRDRILPMHRRRGWKHLMGSLRGWK